MQPWRCDPYLWVHLAGLATVPLWIDLCLLGLAVGNPTLPGLELAVIIGLGVLPVLVMQLRQPFYIFSLPGLALRPTALQPDQRRLLTQFRLWRVRLAALLVPLPLVWLLVKLYPLAFLAREITPFGHGGRLGGLAIATLSFLLANLFLQVPVAVLQVLATSDRRMQTVAPYPVDTIAAAFAWFGWVVGQILPTLAEAGAEAVGGTNSPPENFLAALTPASLEPVNSTEADGQSLAENGLAHLPLAAVETLAAQDSVGEIFALGHSAIVDGPGLSYLAIAPSESLQPEMVSPPLAGSPRDKAGTDNGAIAPVPLDAVEGLAKTSPPGGKDVANINAEPGAGVSAVQG